MGLHRRLHLDLEGRQDQPGLHDVLGPEPVPQSSRRTSRSTRPGYVNVPSIAGRRNPGYGRNDRTLFTTVLTHKWTDKLTQVMETDQGLERTRPRPGGPEPATSFRSTGRRNASWYSFGNWFLYNFSDKFMGVWRSEVFWDESGARTGPGRRQHAAGAPQGRPLLRDDSRCPDQALRMALDPSRGPLRLVAVPSRIHNETRKSQLTLAFDVIFLF